MKKFLVTDDSIFMRTIMKNILFKNGHEVIGEAENGRIAIEKYKELKPDIVTMDITMNVMNGIDALKEIIAYDRNACVLMVSALGQSPFVQEALASGAKGYLVKPLNEETVIRTITKLS